MSSIVRAARDRITVLRGADPQVGVRLLGTRVARALAFLAQTNPPHTTMEAFATFDQDIVVAAHDLATLPNLPVPAMDETLTQRLARRLRLPHHLNGAALTAMVDVAAAAWLGSAITSSCIDPLLAAHLPELDRFQEHARREQVARLPNGESDLLPASGPALNIAFFKEIFDRDPNLKLQRHWTRLIHTECARRLAGEEGTVNQCAFVTAHTRGRASLVLQLPLSEPAFRMDPPTFIAWFRFYLRIPQLVRTTLSADTTSLGYEAAVCGHEACRGGPLIDLYANHANTGKCPATLLGRAMRHNLLKWSIQYFAVLAGCLATLEPATNRLLRDQFSAEDCRRLFPKAPNAETQKEIKALLEEYAQITQLPRSADRASRLTAANIKLQSMIAQQGTKQGLRIDVHIVDPRSGEEAWVDTTCVHPTAGKYLAAEVALTDNRINATDPAIRDLPSAALRTQHNLKHAAYSMLMALAHRQAAMGMRPSRPTFFPAVITTHGEMCSGLIDLQEWLTAKFRARAAAQGSVDDGFTDEDRTAHFRTRFRMSVTAAMAKGHAAMMLAAGLPMGSDRKEKRQDDDPSVGGGQRPCINAHTPTGACTVPGHQPPDGRMDDTPAPAADATTPTTAAEGSQPDSSGQATPDHADAPDQRGDSGTRGTTGRSTRATARAGRGQRADDIGMEHSPQPGRTPRARRAAPGKRGRGGGRGRGHAGTQQASQTQQPTHEPQSQRHGPGQQQQAQQTQQSPHGPPARGRTRLRDGSPPWSGRAHSGTGSPHRRHPTPPGQSERSRSPQLDREQQQRDQQEHQWQQRDQQEHQWQQRDQQDQQRQQQERGRQVRDQQEHQQQQRDQQERELQERGQQERQRQRDQQERERQERDQQEHQRQHDQQERERQERDQQEHERQQRDQQERERQERDQQEHQRQERDEQEHERQERDQLEQQRQQRDRQERERQERDRDHERQGRDQLEHQRQERAQQEAPERRGRLAKEFVGPDSRVRPRPPPSAEEKREADERAIAAAVEAGVRARREHDDETERLMASVGPEVEAWARGRSLSSLLNDLNGLAPGHPEALRHCGDADLVRVWFPSPVVWCWG